MKKERSILELLKIMLDNIDSMLSSGLCALVWMELAGGGIISDK